MDDKLDVQNQQEHALYVEALRSLEKNGKTSEYRTVATRPIDVQFMHDTQKAVSRTQHLIRYAPGQYERIFQECS